MSWRTPLTTQNGPELLQSPGCVFCVQMDYFRVRRQSTTILRAMATSYIYESD